MTSNFNPQTVHHNGLDFIDQQYDQNLNVQTFTNHLIDNQQLNSNQTNNGYLNSFNNDQLQMINNERTFDQQTYTIFDEMNPTDSDQFNDLFDDDNFTIFDNQQQFTTNQNKQSNYNDLDRLS